ncbi:MAG TPA: 50S ribosomal protein L11 methyltransferase, partial [Leuconostoc mesenteroides]|nr:50S ribosomal protein L11 methyltransferase [Leuconostoc mesenteroides]
MTNNKWQAWTVATNNDGIEPIADILMSTGAEGVQIVDDISPVTVTAYFEDDASLPNTVSRIKEQFDNLVTLGVDASPATITLNDVAQSDWENNWKQYYHATRITRHITVVPSWENFVAAQKDEYPIIMDPKLAFGTGVHETTRLMIQALE